MSNEIQGAVSGRIIELLKEKGVSKSQLAAKCEVQESVVTRWVSGKHNFTLKTLSKIEAVLGERLFEVVGRKRASKPINYFYTTDGSQITFKTCA